MRMSMLRSISGVRCLVRPVRVKYPEGDDGSEMGRRHVCVCGRLAEKALPRGIDGLFVRGRAYEMFFGQTLFSTILAMLVVKAIEKMLPQISRRTRVKEASG